MGTDTAATARVDSKPRRGGAGGYPPAAPASPGLTAEQERVLVEHLPMVRFLARRIHERLPQHVDIEDLVSAGVVGLMDAFSKFDPDKKVQFRSYAQFRVRGAILDSLRTLDWSPRELRRKGRAVVEAIRVLTARLGHAPAENEVAAEMGMDLDEYQLLLGELKGLEIGTLNLEHHEDSGEDELAYVPGRPEDDPLFRCLRGELEDRLTEAIQNLPDRERLVMTLYYYEEMTMREIGLALGVVESRVSQVHASAVVHLRAALRDLASRGAIGAGSKKTGTGSSIGSTTGSGTGSGTGSRTASGATVGHRIANGIGNGIGNGIRNGIAKGIENGVGNGVANGIGNGIGAGSGAVAHEKSREAARRRIEDRI